MSDSDPPACYLFESKGIQRYIFDSGKLRDLMGASELVARLASNEAADHAQSASDNVHALSDLIGHVMAATGGAIVASRRAGASFCLHHPGADRLRRLRALWRLAVGLRCPGLEFSDCPPQTGKTDSEARDKAYAQRSALRDNSAAELPPTGHPFLAYVPRTGRVTTRIFFYPETGSEGSKGDTLVVDAVTEGPRRHFEHLKAQENRKLEPWRGDSRPSPDGKRAVDPLRGVAARFLATQIAGDEESPGDRNKRYVFPRDFETDQKHKQDEDKPFVMPFRGEDRRVAVIHADLSGLGQIFQNLSGQADMATAKTVSDVIEGAIEAAAKHATTTILLPAARGSREHQLLTVPARPIVLGGDDITIVVRADLAIPFTITLLEAIETSTVEVFRNSKSLDAIRNKLGSHLSACAGIAVVGAGHPFLMAYELSESLCGWAKDKAKKAALEKETGRAPSLFAFHVATASIAEDYPEIIRDYQTVRPAGGEVRLTANPYLVADHANKFGKDFASVTTLAKLADCLGHDARGNGKLIEAMGNLFDNSAAAKEQLGRWWTVLGAMNNELRKNIAATLGLSDDVKPQDLMNKLGLLSDALEIIDLAGTRKDGVTGARQEATK